MKFTLIIVFVIMVCVSLFGSGRPFKSDQEAGVIADLAGMFLDRLLTNDFEAAVSGFDDTMSRVMPAEKLRQTWETVLKQAGAFQERSGLRRERTGGYEIVFLTCAFEKALLDIRVVFDAENRIAGLFFTPAQPPYSPPDYAAPSSSLESEVTVWPRAGSRCCAMTSAPGSTAEK